MFDRIPDISSSAPLRLLRAACLGALAAAALMHAAWASSPLSAIEAIEVEERGKSGKPIDHEPETAAAPSAGPQAAKTPSKSSGASKDASSPAAAAAALFSPKPKAYFKLEMTGLKGELLANVDAQLNRLNLDGVSVKGRYRARIRSAVMDGLRALGYYQPKLHFAWQAAPASGPQVLALEVDPGEPVRIKGIEIEILGEAKDDRPFKRLIRTAPKVGAVLNHGEYDKFKTDLSNLAVAMGYFDAKFIKSQLAVSPELREGFWRITYDTGRRYKFGSVTFHGSQIKTSYLDNLVPFEAGDPFNAEKLADLNDKLTQTGWFNSVVVAPEFKRVNDAREIPLYGHVVPKRGNTMEVRAGFSTDVGPRLRADWKRPWVNQYGHSLESSTNLSSKDQLLDFTYKMPVEANPLEEYYVVQGGYKHTDLNDTKSNSMSIMGARWWDMENGWQRSVSLRWMRDSFTQGATDETTMLFYPGVTFSRTRSRGGLMPMWGDSQRYTLDVSTTFLGSDIDFIAASAQWAIIRSLQNKHRFVGRSSLGWIQTNDFDQVPPDLRFFAGGDRSIRGYDYKSISPKDEDGDLRGAKRLFTASIEYQYNVYGKWWGAVFVDTGEAVDKLTSTSFKTGAGIGIRWQSPVGPIKLDIAKPVGDPEEDGIAFYIGLGPEL